MKLETLIRTIDNFPIVGIAFKDISPLLQNPAAFRYAVHQLCSSAAIHKPTAIAAIDARGFILGGAMALELQLPFIPVRKSGKLPADTFCTSYSLEYASQTLCIHRDAVGTGDRVVVHDDVLATGGTAAAAVQLIMQTNATVVQCSFLIELVDLNGRDKLLDYAIASLMSI